MQFPHALNSPLPCHALVSWGGQALQWQNLGKARKYLPYDSLIPCTPQHTCVKSPCWNSSLQQEELREKDRSYKRVARISGMLPDITARFIAEDSSFPIPVTGLFWQGCFDNAERNEIKRHWSVKGLDPQRRRGQSRQEADIKPGAAASVP